MSRNELFIVLILVVGLLATFEYMDMLYTKWETKTLSVSANNNNTNESK